MPELRVVPGNHDDPTPSRPVRHAGSEHPRATPADAARTLAGSSPRGMLSTLTDRPHGYPFGSIVSFALDEHGHPLFVISTMAEHTRNAERDSRASLLVAEDAEGHDPLDAGRVTLIGDLERVDAEGQRAATARVVEHVRSVGRYAHFNDFSCWRLTVSSVRWVGGFGAMDWVDAADYLAAEVDAVLAARRGILDHMNADHADACAAIASRALERDDIVRAEMVAVDRFGCEYFAVTAPDADADVRVRVPFAGVVRDVGEVRHQLVEQTRAAR